MEPLPTLVKQIERYAAPRWRGLASIIATTFLLGAVLAAYSVVDPPGSVRSTAAASGETRLAAGDAGSSQDGATSATPSGPTVTSAERVALAATTKVPGGAPTGQPGGTLPPGVTDDEIEVVYYWTDRTRDSPYRPDSGQANLDEGQGFEALIEWINRHSGDGSTLMGYPFDLHGRKLVPKVIELAKSPEDRARVAEDIAVKHRPFATVASHGSISTYMCDRIAKGGIFNLTTYDFTGDLARRTNGYCFPLGMSWELQVERTVAYLAHQARTSTYTNGPRSEKRVYGIVYAAYPGLHESVEGKGGVVDKLRAAGVDVGHVASINADLGISQAQVPNVIAQLRQAGVNTVVFPDAGAPLNFTTGARRSSRGCSRSPGPRW
jgi:hypothetical protein